MGAKAGEKCGLCGEPMHEGFNSCKACDAIREAKPLLWGQLVAFVVSLAAWFFVSYLLNASGGGIVVGALIGFFVYVALRIAIVPQKTIYTKPKAYREYGSSS
jgi:hypothetical protein